MNKGIVKSILDTDLYKFTTSFGYQKLFPSAQGIFEFKDRKNTMWSEETGKKLLEALNEELDHLQNLKLTLEERDWAIENIPFIPKYYWEWLETFRFDKSDIQFGFDEERHLFIHAGSKEKPLELYKVTLWEIAILCITTELFGRFNGYVYDLDEVKRRLQPKIDLSNESGICFSEFGTRRRASFEIQRIVVEELKKKANFCTGTSNVYLAMLYGMKPMGTFPHEWPMFHGAMYGYSQANHLALEDWVKCYDGYLGIALSDTYTTDVFLKNFSKKLASLFDGVRQDSGDEFEFTEKVIARYKELGINPMTKTIIFSNALDFPKADEIRHYCSGKIRCAFGIGTNLTNDTGNPASNVVMKLMWCRMNSRDTWKPCIKLSDDLGKNMGNTAEIEHCKYELGL